jgi:hypothetical protein
MQQQVSSLAGHKLLLDISSIIGYNTIIDNITFSDISIADDGKNWKESKMCKYRWFRFLCKLFHCCLAEIAKEEINENTK